MTIKLIKKIKKDLSEEGIKEMTDTSEEVIESPKTRTKQKSLLMNSS